MTAQHSSVLEENQRLRAKLENLEQVLKVLLYSETTYIIVFNSANLDLQENCLSSVCVCVCVCVSICERSLSEGSSWNWNMSRHWLSLSSNRMKSNAYSG